jgi:NNP family nitrate/nitrite transporter-like MFS transporter
MAGVVASTFGMMNLFARALGGIVSDRCNRRWGLRGRTLFLGTTIAAEGMAMLLFSRMHALPLAVASMMFTGLFVKMSNGANYSIVPFVNKRAIGAVAGIVGAGGNAGAVLAGFLFKTSSLTYPQAFTILGVLILVCSVFAFAVRFSETDELAARQEMAARLGMGLTPQSAAAGD